MPDRGLNEIVLSEIFIDRFRLGGRFNYYEIFCHSIRFPIADCRLPIVYWSWRLSIHHDSDCQRVD